MGEQQTFLSRLGNMFRRNQVPGDEPPMHGEGGDGPSFFPEGSDPEPRNTFLRPWAKRDQAIDNLHRGIGALADLMTSIRDNMERQADRQEELLKHLSGLPEALSSIPEGSRVQGEALKAIHQQIERQNGQQTKLGEILERISLADSQQGRTLDALHKTVAALSDHDQAISQNLHGLGSALAQMTNNSQASAAVLEQLRDNTASRDGELERVIRKQNTRFTTMLTIAIVLSIAALTAVAVFGYLGYEALTRLK